MSAYAEWESFYVIVGAAAGALMGLQFVVLTLIADRPMPRAEEAGPVFLTPTIVHFGTALLLSCVLRMPWETVTSAAVIWGLTGFAGAVYCAVVGRRMRKQGVYKPALDDWLFYVVVPFAGYALLVVAAFASTRHTHEALLAVGAAAVLLLFIGIRNAWDSVAYHVFVNILRRGRAAPAESGSEAGTERPGR